MTRFRSLRPLLLGTCALGLMVSTPASAQFGGIVYDPSNYAQNVLTAARSLQQINNQITSLQNQAQSLINQARNLASLPTTPQKLAGRRMLPPVSLPRLMNALWAATHAADPPLLPPGTWAMSHGLCVCCSALFSQLLPMANSSRLVLPTIIAPASRRRRTTVAS